MVLGSILNPVLNPILSLPPTLAIAVISLFISLIITIVYKYTTDQQLLKRLRAEMKELQQKLKTADKSNAGELNKQLMSKTMEQTKSSMKSMLYTFIPIIIIFSWMQANVAYEPINPGDTFTTTVHFTQNAQGTISVETGLQIIGSEQKMADEQVTFEFDAANSGEYTIQYNYNNEIYQMPVLVTNQWEYEDAELEQEKRFLGFNIGDDIPIRKGSDITMIETNLEPIHPFGNFRIFGWQPGWLGAYIIFSLIFSLATRKLLKVH